MTLNIAHMLHVVSAAIWIAALVATIVGIGMLPTPEPDDRALNAYGKVAKQVVMWIHIALLVSWITGIWMMFFISDGFSGTGGHVHTMFLTALIMSVMLIASMAGPAKKFRLATSNAGARDALDGVRKYALVGLVLGLVTFAVASFGAAHS